MSHFGYTNLISILLDPRPVDLGSSLIQAGFSSADILRTGGGGFFRCGRPHFWCKNLLIFQILWCVSYKQEEKEGLSQFGHFADNGGRGSIFLDFFTDVFYE